MTTTFCKDCGLDIQQVQEKALDGSYALVWDAPGNGWICDQTGDEHAPESLDSTYARDLENATGGLAAFDLANDDGVFNDIVDTMENKGHSRARVERSLRSWIESETGAEADDDLMDPVEALTFAILAINTAEAPDATSAEDLAYLNDSETVERALACLDEIREWVIAQGDDFPTIGLGRGE